MAFGKGVAPNGGIGLSLTILCGCEVQSWGAYFQEYRVHFWDNLGRCEKVSDANLVITRAGIHDGPRVSGTLKNEYVFSEYRDCLLTELVQVTVLGSGTPPLPALL